MPRPTRLQITRDRRKDGSVTFGLRVRAGGADQRLALGNTDDGWDEARAETARKQLLAKIELGLWTPGVQSGTADGRTGEPTFRELATDWLDARKRNPAIRPRTTELNESQVTRYLLPFFGESRPSEITTSRIKSYREHIQTENAQIRSAAERGHPLRDPRSGQRLRTLSNDSINKTLRTLAQILDEAEDAGWIERNPARGRRTREPLERRRHKGTLEVDEFGALLEAAEQLDRRHTPQTLARADLVRRLRDDAKLEWRRIGQHLGVAPTTAMYLYECREDTDTATCGPRRAIVATLGLVGLRAGELCALDNQDIDLARARLHIADAKTEAGVRAVDIHPRLLDELTAYARTRAARPLDAPAFPARTGRRRDRHNILARVISPALVRANELRAAREELPIRAHVTPHTLRRTYITFMITAGYDLPYVQAQVGHVHPSTTLAIYAQVMRRADRDELRVEIRDLLGVEAATTQGRPSPITAVQSRPRPLRLGSVETAVKGRARSL